MFDAYRSPEAGASLEQSLEYEAYMQEIAGRLEDARDGMKAFIERRSPTFKAK